MSYGPTDSHHDPRPEPPPGAPPESGGAGPRHQHGDEIHAPLIPGARPPLVLAIPRRLRFWPRRGGRGARGSGGAAGAGPARPAADKGRPGRRREPRRTHGAGEGAAAATRWLRARAAALPELWREALYRVGLAETDDAQAGRDAAPAPGPEPVSPAPADPEAAGLPDDDTRIYRPAAGAPEAYPPAVGAAGTPGPGRRRARWTARREAARVFDRWSPAGAPAARHRIDGILDRLGDWGTVAVAVAVVLLVSLFIWRPADVPTLGPGRPSGADPDGRLPVTQGGINPLAGRVVAIDPGHGGKDRGASHAGFDWTEKDLTLDIARRLARVLEAHGAVAVITRDGDDLPEGGMSNQRTLRHRLDVARKAGAELLVSIHVNSFSVAKYFGPQTFFYPGNPGGEPLARSIQEELLRLQPESGRDVKAEDFFLLRNAEFPAALVEVGFISSPRDRSLLASEEYREAVARALAVALARFWAGVPNATGR